MVSRITRSDRGNERTSTRRVLNKLYIGDLLETVTKTQLEREFGRFGRLQDVWLAHNPPGFAFVCYDDTRDALEAVRALDGRQCLGSRIRVEFAKSSGPVKKDRSERLRTTDLLSPSYPLSSVYADDHDRLSSHNGRLYTRRPLPPLPPLRRSLSPLGRRISPLGRRGLSPSELLGLRYPLSRYDDPLFASMPRPPPLPSSSRYRSRSPVDRRRSPLRMRDTLYFAEYPPQLLPSYNLSHDRHGYPSPPRRAVPLPRSPHRMRSRSPRRLRSSRSPRRSSPRRRLAVRPSPPSQRRSPLRSARSPVEKRGSSGRYSSPLRRSPVIRGPRTPPRKTPPRKRSPSGRPHTPLGVGHSSRIQSHRGNSKGNAALEKRTSLSGSRSPIKRSAVQSSAKAARSYSRSISRSLSSSRSPSLQRVKSRRRYSKSSSGSPHRYTKRLSVPRNRRSRSASPVVRTIKDRR